MIRAKDLDGRDVVDLESAEKIGHVDEIFLDPAGGRIAAYSVSAHSSLVGGGRRTFLPPSVVESIGPEAIMVRPGFAREAPTNSPESFPRLSQVTGRKVVTQSGKLVGAVSDVLIDGPPGTIVGYRLKDAGWTGRIGEMLLPDEDHEFDYVRADADIRLGDDLLVVPDNAVVHGEKSDEHHERSAIAALGQRHPVSERTTTHESAPAFSPLSAPVDASAPATTRHWHDVQPGFRSRWEQGGGTRGGLWEEYEPAYRYGWEMSNEPRYRGRSWDVAESDLQRDWTERHPDRPWDRFSAAVREAWDSMTGSDHDHTHRRHTTHETVRHEDSPRGSYDGTRSLL